MTQLPHDAAVDWPQAGVQSSLRPQAPEGCGRQALFVANTDWYLWNFRLPLLRALKERGWEVLLASPPGAWADRLVAEGFCWRPLIFDRHGLNPLAEAAALIRVVRLYRALRPDLVHHFTIKCVLYGGIAAKLSRVSGVVNAVTGLGTLFTTKKGASLLLLPLIRVLYRFALRDSHVIFQNPDDLRAFREQGLLGGATTHLIRGSGVNVNVFMPAGAPGSVRPTVILVARLLREKGIEEFVEAARSFSTQEARFLVVGGEDPEHPAAIAHEVLRSWREEARVEFLGHRDDVRELLQQSHVACLPSWREGTPRSLLEAMACGLPLVATDVPGCREVTRDGDNGLLVEPRNPVALARGLRQLIENPELRARMGRRSRERAVEEFSQEYVLGQTLSVYQSALD